MQRRLTAAAVVLAGTVLGSLTYAAMSAATAGPGVHPGSDGSTAPVPPAADRAGLTAPDGYGNGRHEIEGGQPAAADPEDRADGREDRASEPAEPEDLSGESQAQESQENSEESSGEDSGEHAAQQDESDDSPDD
jgi:hypothetical protein